MSKTVLTVYGTRPEAIKVAPVIRGIEASSQLHSVTAVTGQHRSMLDQVNTVFGITPDYDLDIFDPGQGLNDLMSKVLARLDPLLHQIQPDALLVQGDTSTVAAAAIAGFNRAIPVVHLEAGLRSGDISSPFPEEGNRRLTSHVATLHLAPTPAAKDNLLAEGVPAESITVTGNTVIDALQLAQQSATPFADPRLSALAASTRRVVLVTTHRRESWGGPMRGIGAAVARLADRHPDVVIVVPLHRNPVVRQALAPALDGVSNVLVTEPLGYGEFVRLMARSVLILTDSGGVQEEGPSLGKPVLVMRETTERPEAVEAGVALLVGTDEDVIVREVSKLLDDPAHLATMANAVNPYGDGQAAMRCVAAIEALLGRGPRLAEFTWEAT